MSSSSADVLSAQLPGSSKSLPKQKLQWQANTSPEVYIISHTGSRSKKFEVSPPSVTAMNQVPPNKISEGGSSSSSLKLNQALPASTAVTQPTQTTSLPGTSKLNNDPIIPNNDGEVGSKNSSTPTVDALKINETTTATFTVTLTQKHSLSVTTTDHSVVNQDQSGMETKVKENPDPVKSLQKDDENKAVECVCKTCQGKYEKEEITTNVEEWLYDDTCANCRKVFLSHHRSISRLQSPKHHTTTNNSHEEEVNSCCCC